jgi:hypothetical protein
MDTKNYEGAVGLPQDFHSFRLFGLGGGIQGADQTGDEHASALPHALARSSVGMSCRTGQTPFLRIKLPVKLKVE